MQWGKGKVTNKKPLTPVVALVELGREEEGEMILRMPSRKKRPDQVEQRVKRACQKSAAIFFPKLADNNASFVGGEILFDVFYISGW